MNRVIYQLAFRESGFFVVPVIVILMGYCLFQQMPLRHFDSVVLLLSVALGFGLGKFVFSDKPGVRSFLFSRAYSPKRFFLVRWSFGLLVIGVTALVIAAITSTQNGMNQMPKSTVPTAGISTSVEPVTYIAMA